MSTKIHNVHEGTIRELREFNIEKPARSRRQTWDDDFCRRLRGPGIKNNPKPSDESLGYFQIVRCADDLDACKS